jgi:hypothetical protein
MHIRIDNSTMTFFRAAIFVLGVVVIFSGCNQHRYKPAKWRAAARKTTLPVDDKLSTSNVRWTSLPMARKGSLPMRNAGGSTLPNRGGIGGTLPMRNWSTLPGRGMTTLPLRGGGMNTLPQRQTYPEYRLPRRNWTTLPRAGAQQPQPNRWTGTTLPR